MGRWRVAAWVAIGCFVPAMVAALEAPSPPGDSDDAEEEVDPDADVAGAPLLPPPGKVRSAPVPGPPPFLVPAADGWGIPEHRLYVVPAHTERPALYQGDVARIPPPPWPGRHLLAGEPFPTAWTFPELYPMVNASLATIAGREGGSDETVFIERAQANLYLLELGVDLVRAIGTERVSQPTIDLDLRIPIALGERSRLALVPGISFPKTDETFAVRTRLAYGAGIGRLAFQTNGGYAAGTRPGGMLGSRQDLAGPTFLAGALLAYRIHEKVQPRVEADLGFGVGRNEDYGTLAAGLNFFPWGDPRLELGLAAILEGASGGGGGPLDRPSVGALLHLQINFQ